MVVYKAYDKNLGWTRDYKGENGELLFNFGKGYVKNNNYSMGFEVLSDYNMSADMIKQVGRDKKISDIFDEYYGYLYTDHLYKYPTNFRIGYYELEAPYFYLHYEKGVFLFSYYQCNSAECIPISYVNELSGCYIDLELLELVGNRFENFKKCEELWLVK